MSLPIEAIIPDLKSALVAQNCAVLVAAPGAGKTTRVPLALLDQPWLKGGKIIMLEPRRLAARAGARNRTGGDDIALEAHQNLGRGADDLMISHVGREHVG